MCRVPERTTHDPQLAVSLLELVRGLQSQSRDEQFRNLCMLQAGCSGLFAAVCSIRGEGE